MRTLIFDCDGVLVDSEAIAEDTLVAYLSRWLPDLNIDQALGQALGMTTADILRHLEALSAHALPLDATEQVDTAIEARLARELKAIDGPIRPYVALRWKKRWSRTVGAVVCWRRWRALAWQKPLVKCLFSRQTR